MTTNKKPSPAIITLIAVVLIGVSTTGIVLMLPRKEANNNPQPQSAPTKSYKDGIYDAQGYYPTPGGMESIDITVTLGKDVIKDISLIQQGKTETAKDFQSRFASGYKDQVVGKKISEVKLTRVAGSSLTPIGFNDALDQVEEDAKE